MWCWEFHLVFLFVLKVRGKRSWGVRKAYKYRKVLRKKRGTIWEWHAHAVLMETWTFGEWACVSSIRGYLVSKRMHSTDAHEWTHGGEGRRGVLHVNHPYQWLPWRWRYLWLSNPQASSVTRDEGQQHLWQHNSKTQGRVECTPTFTHRRPAVVTLVPLALELTAERREKKLEMVLNWTWI